MKKLFRVLFTIAVLLVFSGSCKHENENISPTPDKPTPNIREEREGFVAVPVPKEVIIGKMPAYKVPYDTDIRKGAFVEGRKIKLSPYAIARHELTYKLYKEVYDWASEHGYEFAEKSREGGMGKIGQEAEEEGMPVTQITWRDAVVWCNAYTEKTLTLQDCVYTVDGEVLKKSSNEKKAMPIDINIKMDRTKKGFRLPTVAEWEYASRFQKDNVNAENYGTEEKPIWLTCVNSASGAKKPIGFVDMEKGSETWESLRDELLRLCVCDEWYDGTDFAKVSPPTKNTAKVGSKGMNALGVFDMSGNVWEWCFDWYDENPQNGDEQYKNEEGVIVDPAGPKSPVSGGFRADRGGSWKDNSYETALGVIDMWHSYGNANNLGVRLVYSME